MTTDTLAAPAAELPFLAQRSDGSTVHLVPLLNAESRLASATRCLPREALGVLLAAMQRGAWHPYLLPTTAHEYGEAVTDATVVRRAREGGAAVWHAPRRQGFVTQWKGTQSDAALETLARVAGSFGGTVRVAAPAHASRAVGKATPALVGITGLAELMRDAANGTGAQALLGLRVGMREDQLRAILAEQTPQQQAPAECALRITPRVWLSFGKSCDGDSLRLVHLEDLAHALSASQPPARARDQLLAALRSDTAALYVARNGDDDFAPMVTDETRWCHALVSGSATWAARRELDAALTVIGPYMHRMDGAEALLRGCRLDDASPAHAAAMSEAEWKALPARAALIGRAGALDAFALACVRGAERAAPEFVAQVRALAITEADAARLFPGLAKEQRSFWQRDLEPVDMVATATAVGVTLQPGPLALVASIPVAAGAQAESKLIGIARSRWKNVRGHWTDELLERADYLMTQAGGSHSPQAVATELGISRPSLLEALKRRTAKKDKAADKRQRA